jgi:NAD(P)-dependent dehydrogenase (short-subunit alcohol dehydrogenase family)
MRPQRVLVTGGGRGIGQGIALSLSSSGMQVAICARSTDQLDQTVQASGGHVVAFRADVAQENDTARLVRAVEKEFGGIDLLVNNAALGGPFEPIWECDAEAWWRCIEVNLRGPFLCSKAVLPAMIARGEGRIVNLASGAGTQAYPNLSAYVMSKTALVRLTEQIALEAGGHGVRAFAIMPGIVQTGMVEEARVKLPYIQQMLDSGLAVTPEESAKLIRFLASGKGDTLSGGLIWVGDDYEAMAAEGVRPLLRLQR